MLAYNIKKSMISELEVFLMAMAPLGELRLAIPAGLTLYQFSWWKTYVIALSGNLIVALFLLLFLQNFSGFLKKHLKTFDKLFWRWLAEVQKRANPYVIKYGFWGLIVFVAIPLPLTGAWAASAAAFLLGIPLRIALFSIALGLVVSGMIVTGLSLSGISLVNQFINFYF